MSDSGDNGDDQEVLQSKTSSFKKSDTPATKPKRVASRFCNALLAVVFLILFVLCLVSFSGFSYVYQRTADKGTNDRTCILNADWHSDSDIRLGTDGSCRLAIGGEVVIAVYALLSIIVMIIKIIGGWSMMSCFLIFELLTAVLMLILSFCTSVVLSVGFSLTCSGFSSQQNGGGCGASYIDSFYFHSGLQVAEATAWLGCAVLLGITIFYILCVIMYCYGKRQARKAKAGQ